MSNGAATVGEASWPRRFGLHGCGLLIGLLGQLLSFFLWVRPAGVTSIWVSGGVFLAFLLTRAPRQWPALIFGFINGGTLAFLLRDGRYLHALIGYAWMAICLAVTACALRRPLSVQMFAGIPELLRFFLIAVVALPAISGAGAVAMIILAGGKATFPDTWLLAAPAHAASYMLLTPLSMALLRWRKSGSMPAWHRVREVALVCAGSWILSYALWKSFPTNLSSLPILLFAPIPLLLLAAVRFDRIGTALTLLATIIPAGWEALYLDSANNVRNGYVNASIMQLWAVAIGLLFYGLNVQSHKRRTMHGLLSASHGQIRNLAMKLMRSQEDERVRISRELHDGINQQIASAAVALSTLKKEGKPIQPERLDSLRESLLHLMSDVRRISHNLHPAILQHVGLANALGALVDDLRKHWGGTIDFAFDLSYRRPDLDASLCLYRIAQEALRNAIEHADASVIRVRLSGNASAYVLEIVDDGRGFDVENVNRQGGLGLLSMQERARQFKGKVDIGSEIGKGTRIWVEISAF